jgi:hypothetical protein
MYIYICVFYIKQFPTKLQSFKAKVVKRKQGGNSPSTAKAQKMAVKTLASFCILYHQELLMFC